jgi:GH25 family lysozyme M1 (1,4-beta-N-acetylmuramidase)
LYFFLTVGSSTTPFPSCDGDQACNWGAAAAEYAVNYASGQGVDTHVTWWLDVEGAGSYWSDNQQTNAAVVAGAISAFHAVGLTVGIYTSPLAFSAVVGGYQPNVPVWIAWYTDNPEANCADAVGFAVSNNDTLPTGGIWLTQYTDNGGALDGDYAC